MPEDKANILYKTHTVEQSKYDYFLLAVAGASIGFALTQTQGITLADSQWPLGVAILCWGVSFFSGCHRLGLLSSVRLINVDLLKVEKGTHPLTGNDPAYQREGHKILHEKLDEKIDKAASAAMWQFRLLIAGAVFYIAWHIYEMYLRGLN